MTNIAKQVSMFAKTFPLLLTNLRFCASTCSLSPLLYVICVAYFKEPFIFKNGIFSLMHSKLTGNQVPVFVIVYVRKIPHFLFLQHSCWTTSWTLHATTPMHYHIYCPMCNRLKTDWDLQTQLYTVDPWLTCTLLKNKHVAWIVFTNYGTLSWLIFMRTPSDH